MHVILLLDFIQTTFKYLYVNMATFFISMVQSLFYYLFLVGFTSLILQHLNFIHIWLKTISIQSLETISKYIHEYKNHARMQLVVRRMVILNISNTSAFFSNHATVYYVNRLTILLKSFKYFFLQNDLFIGTFICHSGSKYGQQQLEKDNSSFNIL